MSSKGNSQSAKSGMSARLLRAAALWISISAVSIPDSLRAAPNDPWEGGQWGPIINWPHVPVSAANLPDGRVLTWSGSERLFWPTTEQSYTTTWNPNTSVFQEIFHPSHNMFCADQVLLKDGRVFVNGGRNANNSPWTSIFDYKTNQWQQIENMASGGRWYPTTLTLGDGSVFTAIGSSTLPRNPDVWHPGSGWQIKNGIDFSNMVLTPYAETHNEARFWPLLHLAPNGQIFHSGPTPRMHYIDPEGGIGNNGTYTEVGSPFTDWYHKEGTTIMYAKGKLLTAGGWAGGTNHTSTNKAFTIDLNGPSPVLTLTGSMNYARKFHNGVILPSGEVLVIGGNSAGTKFSDNGMILASEIWNPATGQWRLSASMAIPRNYHSVALLLTDGRVFAGGGGYCNGDPVCGGATHPDAQIYSPAYLFNSNGSLAARPTIQSGPEQISSGQEFDISGSAGLQKFSLIKMSSTTHGVNTDVRFLDVPFVVVSPGNYRLTADANPNVLSPGYWMLFGLNASGVPSVAHVLQANAGSLPSMDFIANQQSPLGDPVSMQIAASDPDNDPLTYSATGLPGGLSINTNSGLVSGTPFADGIYQVAITVDDNEDGTAVRNFSWTIFGGGTGFITRDWWSGLPGTTVSSLTSSPDFPDSPTDSEVLTSFEGPMNFADNYGSRIFGYLEADTSGPHTFWIAADNAGELWLSSNTGEANKVLIASVPQSTGTHEWTKYPEQQSAAVELVAGQRYFIEALHKEGSGTDNFAVAWKRPGDAGPQVIPGNNLSTEPVAPPATLADSLLTGALTDVGSDWVTVTLSRTYTTMVVVATPQYDGSALPAITRIRNATGNSFQVRVQNPSDSPLSGYRVHYVVVEAGVHNDGQTKFEAATFSSTRTDYKGSWVGQPVLYQQAYTNPVVLGQVMTSNDTKWSTFWASLSGNKNQPPRTTSLSIGKHVGEDPVKARVNETLGYIVIEAGSGVLGSVGFEAAVGPNIVEGVTQASAPDNYPLNASFTTAVLSSAAMRDGNGGWPLLYGSTPLAGNNIALGYDEDQTKDTEREHGPEFVAYLALFGDAEDPLQIDPVVPSPAVSGSSVAFVVSSNQNNLLYSYSYGDGTPATPFVNDPNGEHTYSMPGRYVVTINIIDPTTGATYVQTFVQLIHAPLTPNKPTSSSSIVIDSTNGQLWVVNPDNDSVTIIDESSQSVLNEIPVGDQPVTLALGPSNTVWVTNKKSATISVMDRTTFNVLYTLNVTAYSQPHGIVFNPAGTKAFIALEGTGDLLALDASTAMEVGRTYMGPNIRHVSVSADGNKVLVTRFITPPLPNESTASPIVENGGVYFGGDVMVLDAGTLDHLYSIPLRNSDRAASENTGPGVPNYLGPAVISPDGLSAWVPSKQDNILAGTLRGGDGMSFDQTVRAVTSKLDLVQFEEDFPARVDHDNSSVATAVAFDKYGSYLFTALESSREIAVSDAYTSIELLRFDVGRAPQGVAVSADGNRLYVHNFMDRSVGFYDISEIVEENVLQVVELVRIATVSGEALPQQVFVGKQFFYDARDPRLAHDSYMSCASCHNDGGQDGRVWDFTGMGEGLRNTITLEGRGGVAHGFLHWSANFDEVQDFEGQIRGFAGGTGLMSDSQFLAGTRSQPLGDTKTGLSADLDALAAYVNSLTSFPDSPHRNTDGTLTADGELGLLIFERENCAQCHRPLRFTDSTDASTLHDAGTMTAASGNRLGGPLTGIDTPTLVGVWQSAPFLHDGSAYDVTEAVSAHSGLGISLTTAELNQLGAYLEQLDDVTRSISNVVPEAPVQFGSVSVAQPDSAFWHSVTFAQPFVVAPIVVMGPPSYQDPAPTTVRVRNVSAAGFQFQIDEWEYLDGVHGTETIAWIAAEPGIHDLGGITVEAASHTPISNKWRTPTFTTTFSELPTVIAQVVTTNEPTAISLRIRSLTTSNFQIKVAEEEAENGVHANETLHFLAFSAGSAIVNGKAIAAGKSGPIVGNSVRTLGFGGSFPAPLFLATSQGFNGDPAAIRYTVLSPSQVSVFMEEEASADAEANHSVEDVGWVVISNL